MDKSESIANLAKALTVFQKTIKNPANTADNPFFKSKYAPLSDILNLVRPLLSECGLTVIQSPGGNGESISITTLLLHDSGEWIESDPVITKADKVTAQGAGSAITYLRRYSLSAVLGISSEDDDDGNHVSQPPKKFNESESKELDKKLADEKRTLCGDCNKPLSIKEIDWCNSHADKFKGKLLCQLCQKKPDYK